MAPKHGTQSGGGRQAAIAGAGVAGLIVIGGGIYLLTQGKSSHPRPKPTPATTAHPTSTTPAPAAVPRCPLSGLPAPHGVPARPAIAVKVENLPLARPQSGLDRADIVFEEPVEAGITRFVVVYQCNSAAKIEPVRSSRLIDPLILDQLSRPIFAFAGGIGPSRQAAANANDFDADFTRFPGAYQRDPNRSAPHNLFVSTAALWSIHHGKAPAPIFKYSSAQPTGARATSVHVPFSSYSDITWTYDSKMHGYLRSYSGGPTATTASGAPITAANVVVIKAVETITPYVEDVNGAHEVMLGLLGSGQAVVFRGGVAIQANWTRPNRSSPTRLTTPAGTPIALQPGRTWVELVPTSIPVTFG